MFNMAFNQRSFVCLQVSPLLYRSLQQIKLINISQLVTFCSPSKYRQWREFSILKIRFAVFLIKENYASLFTDWIPFSVSAIRAKLMWLDYSIWLCNHHVLVIFSVFCDLWFLFGAILYQEQLHLLLPNLLHSEASHWDPAGMLS